MALLWVDGYDSFHLHLRPMLREVRHYLHPEVLSIQIGYHQIHCQDLEEILEHLRTHHCRPLLHDLKFGSDQKFFKWLPNWNHYAMERLKDAPWLAKVLEERLSTLYRAVLLRKQGTLVMAEQLRKILTNRKWYTLLEIEELCLLNNQSVLEGAISRRSDEFMARLQRIIRIWT